MAVLADLSVTSTGYRLLLFGHLLFVIVGFGSSFVWPLLGREASKRRGGDGVLLSDVGMDTSKIVTTPFIYAAGAFGALLVGFGPYGVDQTWVWLSIALFVTAVVFSAAVHAPNLTRMNRLAHELAAGSPPGAVTGGPPAQALELERRGKAAARNGGILHLLFAVLLVLMVWRPGA